MSTSPMTVAFIGLGNMGAPMAANLAKAGQIVSGFDLAETSRNAAKQAGINVAVSARVFAAGRSSKRGVHQLGGRPSLGRARSRRCPKPMWP